jgi:hypothetical protein
MDGGVSTREGATGTSFGAAPPDMMPQATAGTATTGTTNNANRPVTMESRPAT